MTNLQMIEGVKAERRSLVRQLMKGVALCSLAVRFGTTRLIDNLVLGG